MNDNTMQKFLNGELNEQEFQRLEAWMQRTECQVSSDIIEPIEKDSLVQSIRNFANRWELNPSTNSEVFTEHMETLVGNRQAQADSIMRMLDPSDSPTSLGRIGEYEIEELIAVGGMGVIFRALDERYRRTVCIKILHPDLLGRAEAKARLERESRAAVRIQSEHIVTVLSIGDHRGLPFMVMQLLDGESLRTRLMRVGKIEPNMVIEFLIHILQGLRDVHAHGLIHRDIKPDNVWITTDNNVKLLDFGLAHDADASMSLTTSGGILGTPQYMSPEQVQGKPLDQRSDLFSVGTLAYEMLTGIKPFQSSNVFSSMMAITQQPLDDEPLRALQGIRPELVQFVSQLLEKSADDRPEDVSQALHLLKQMDVQALPIIASSKSRSGYRFPLWPMALAGAAGMFVTCAIVLFFQLTDKGTLVIEASDTHIELQLRSESVRIKDALTQREYDVKVGQASLPSGVYQLEMNDAVSGLTFSSSTIIIRRGDKTIVKVDLKSKATEPKLETAAQSAEENSQKIVVSEGIQTPSRPSSIWTANSNDPSFDQEALKSFASKLWSLPSIPWVDAGIQANPNSRPVYHGHQKLDTIERWSIQAKPYAQYGLENADGSLFAGLFSRGVCITDRMSEAKYILPTSGASLRPPQFDSVYPNLVATITAHYSGTGKSFSNSERSRIDIWRLHSHHAELLKSLDSRSFGCYWDRGYRLIYLAPEGLSAYRLDLGKSLEIPVRSLPESPLNKFLLFSQSMNAISPNGRYVILRTESGNNVIDLHRGELAISLQDTRQVLWADDDPEKLFALISKDQRMGGRSGRSSDPRTALQRQISIETWNLNNRTQTHRAVVHFEDLNIMGGKGPSVVSSVRVSTDGNLLAWVDNNRLTIQEVKSNLQRSYTLANADFYTLAWKSSICLQIQSRDNVFRWIASKPSEVFGTIEKINPSEAPPYRIPTEFSSMLVAGGSQESCTIGWQNSRSEKGQFRIFNWEALAFTENAPMITMPFIMPSRQRTGSVGKPKSFVSPSGKRGLLPLEERTGPRTRFELVSLVDGTKHEMPQSVLGINDVKWSDDESRIVVLSVSTLLFEAATQQWITPAQLGVKGDVLSIDFSGNDLFVLSSLQDQIRVWIVRKESSIAEAIPELDSILAISGKPSQLRVSESNFMISTYTNIVGKDGPMRRLLRIPRSIVSEPTAELMLADFELDRFIDIQMSPDLEHFIVLRSTPGSSVPNESPVGSICDWSENATRISIEEFLKSGVKRIPVEITGTAAKPFKSKLELVNTNARWHSKLPIASFEKDARICLYDASTNQVNTSEFDSGNNVFQTNHGWIVATWDGLIYVLDPKGSTQGTLVFDHQAEDDAPSHASWIAPDGALHKKSSSQGLNIMYVRDQKEYVGQSLDRFKAEHPNVIIPMIDSLPFEQ